MDVNWCRFPIATQKANFSIGYYALFKSSLELNFQVAEAVWA